MISKQTWDVYRRNTDLPLFIIYDYYVEHKKANRVMMTFEQFQEFLPKFIQTYEGMELMLDNNPNRRVIVTYQTMVYRVCRFYEEKYYSNEIRYGEVIPPKLSDISDGGWY